MSIPGLEKNAGSGSIIEKKDINTLKQLAFKKDSRFNTGDLKDLKDSKNLKDSVEAHPVDSDDEFDELISEIDFAEGEINSIRDAVKELRKKIQAMWKRKKTKKKHESKETISDGVGNKKEDKKEDNTRKKDSPLHPINKYERSENLENLESIENYDGDIDLESVLALSLTDK